MVQDVKVRQELLVRLLSLVPNLQLFHWQTRSFARHEASGDLYEEMVEKIDEFMEVYISKHGRPKALEKTRLTIHNLNAKSIVAYLNDYIHYFENLDKSIKLTPDMLNIRDEIVAEIRRTLYRFTLS